MLQVLCGKKTGESQTPKFIRNQTPEKQKVLIEYIKNIKKDHVSFRTKRKNTRSL